jgi:hypothetical protein
VEKQLVEETEGIAEHWMLREAPWYRRGKAAWMLLKIHHNSGASVIRLLLRCKESTVSMGGHQHPGFAYWDDYGRRCWCREPSCHDASGAMWTYGISESIYYDYLTMIARDPVIYVWTAFA